MKYFYLRDKHKTPIACVASVERDGLVYFAVSTWNPKDKFDKGIAKAVARGRLAGATHRVNLGPQVKSRICSIIAADYIMPAKTRQAAQLWLDNYIPNISKEQQYANIQEFLTRLNSPQPLFIWTGPIQHQPRFLGFGLDNLRSTELQSGGDWHPYEQPDSDNW